MADVIEQIDIKDFQSLSAIGKKDNILLSCDGALGGAKISFELFLAMVAKDVKPIIKDGNWYIGGFDTGVNAIGKTPTFRTTSVGIEYQYEGDVAWMSLVSYEVLKLKFTDLTPEQQLLLKGDKGTKGDTGDTGETGTTGKSAYQIAVENGYKDTEVQFGKEQAAIANNSARLLAVEANKQDKPIAGRTFLTPLFVARGAKFNDKTGFYELNGLTDITEAQMITIYNESSALYGMPSIGELYINTNMRTNFTELRPSMGANILGNLNVIAMFYNSRNIEIVSFLTTIYPTHVIRMFMGCSKLRKIRFVFEDHTFMMYNIQDTALMFSGCVALESVRLKRIERSLSLADSSKLDKDSILYLINNATNLVIITITLHPIAKARLTEEDIALAASKNITIA